MKTKLSTLQVQKPILAPSMQQSIEILLLPLIELDQAVELELQNNPLLEIDEQKALERKQLETLVTAHINHLQKTDSHDSPLIKNNIEDDQEETMERAIVRVSTLEEHLLGQLKFEISDPAEMEIGEFIIGNLNEDGYLKLSVEEIAETLQKDVAEIERILKIVQTFDPIGIASRDLKECLSLQAQHKFNGHAKILTTIIQNHLDELGRKNYIDIGRKLKIPVDTVKDIVREISSLEPRPARKFRPLPHNIYVKPDIFVKKDEDGNLQIVVNQDNIPPLRINSVYQNMLKQPNRTQEEIDFIREKVKNALLFIKSIEQRNQTMKGIAQYILEHQRDFFEEGTSALRPMILKDVAETIGRNESTVSRAIHNKYMETPQGMFPLKFFFSNSIQSTNEGKENISTRSIKEDLKSLIDEEDKTNPLSDNDIQLHFAQKGMPIARRTINKYRKMLNILPSHLRKE
jgi:RNA polymerase sigma-54 factor